LTQPVLPYLEYAAQDGKPHSVQGELVVLPQVAVPTFGTTRDILVYLPPAYHTSERRFPVLYMQDGQNLFDAATAFGGNDWHADETMERLSGDGYEAIIVGVPHAGDGRLVEYNPFPGRMPSKGEEYVAFLSEMLKPFMDAEFRTIPDARATGIIGSSMGGLISLYAFFRRPDVFGLCGALSPSLFVGRGAILRYVQGAPFNPGKIYLDNGSREPTARPMLEELHRKGYRVKRDLKYVNEFGGTHTESAWARRLPGVLRFLLKDWKEWKGNPSEEE